METLSFYLMRHRPIQVYTQSIVLVSTRGSLVVIHGSLQSSRGSTWLCLLTMTRDTWLGSPLPLRIFTLSVNIIALRKNRMVAYDLLPAG